MIGSKMIIEAKGKFTSQDRKKMKLVTEQYPNLDIRLLFQRDQPINKGSKTYYSDWCHKNNIQFAVKVIPNEWL